MKRICDHLDQATEVVPSGQSYVECLETGDGWVRLRPLYSHR